MLTDEGDISSYLEFNINKHSDKTFKLSQSHLAEKIINHVGLTVSASLKTRETTIIKQSLDKNESSIGRKYVWNYRAAVGILGYLQGSTWP